MKKVHLLGSTNWSQKYDPDRWLAPLSTMLDFIAGEDCELDRLILIGGDHENDQKFCSLANQLLSERGVKADLEARIRTGGDPAVIAKLVSNAISAAARDNAGLWVDLTPGPKERSAVIFAAASAVPDALIFYSQLEAGGYRIRQLARMGSYNAWIGRHGIRIRDYREELRHLAEMYERERPVSRDEIYLAVADLLSPQPGLQAFASTARTNVITMAEWVHKETIPRLFGKPGFQGEREEDEIIRSVDKKDSKTRSAGRAGQTLYQLRCLFAHDKPDGQQPVMDDALALLDCLAFLSARLSDRLRPDDQPSRGAGANVGARIFVAVDGDDVGRSFEQRLADCVGVEDVLALERWSQHVQRELSDLMIRLKDHCDAVFLVRTGDGFLAAVPKDRLSGLMDNFNPKFSDVAVTTGVGPTVKDSYLALKLGKAKNRGGGTFYSFNPPDERVLWIKAGFV